MIAFDAKHTARSLRAVLIIVMLLHVSSLLHAQLPPRPIQVTKTADLAFGAFYLSASGGTVDVSATGLRTSTGDIVLLGMGVTVAPAIFNVRGNTGTLVTPVLGGTVTLNGSPMGNLTLNLNPTTDPVSPFVISGPLNTVSSVDLHVGGTLTVGASASNPPGSYSGTFTITFTQNYN